MTIIIVDLCSYMNLNPFETSKTTKSQKVGQKSAYMEMAEKMLKIRLQNQLF